MATVVRAAKAGDCEEEEGWVEGKSQGALMFVMQAGDLNTATTWNWVAVLFLYVRATPEQWHSVGIAVSMGDGNNWACRSCLLLCVCVFACARVWVELERVRQTEMCVCVREREMKMQRQHTHSAGSFCLYVCVLADELYLREHVQPCATQYLQKGSVNNTFNITSFKHPVESHHEN